MYMIPSILYYHTLSERSLFLGSLVGHTGWCVDLSACGKLGNEARLSGHTKLYVQRPAGPVGEMVVWVRD